MKLSDKAYNILKFACLICLPACAVLYGTLADVWGLPLKEQIVTTINAVALFIGANLQISSNKYWEENEIV